MMDQEVAPSKSITETLKSALESEVAQRNPDVRRKAYRDAILSGLDLGELRYTIRSIQGRSSLERTMYQDEAEYDFIRFRPTRQMMEAGMKAYWAARDRPTVALGEDGSKVARAIYLAMERARDDQFKDLD